MKRKKRAYGKITKRFIFEIATTLSPCTVENYNTLLNHFFNWMIKEYDFKESDFIKKINRDILQKYRLSIIYLNQNTRASRLISMRSYFKWLYENKYLNIDPHILIKKEDIPRHIKTLPKPLNNEIDTKLISYFEKYTNDLYCNAFLLLRLTGLRISELLNLSTDCIKEDNQRFSLKVPAGKTKAERIVPLCNKAYNAITQINNLRKNLTKNKNNNFLIPLDQKNRNKLIRDRSKYIYVKRKFENICKNIGFSKNIHIHQFRHTYATELLNAGMDLIYVSRCLGHNDLKMTMRYCRVTNNDVFEQYIKIQNNILKPNSICLPPKLSNNNNLSTISDITNSLNKLFYTITEISKQKVIKRNIRRLKIIISDFNKNNLNF